MQINKLLTPYNLTKCDDVGRIKYIVIHYVGATSNAEANCRYYASQYVGASAHYYVDFDGSIWQSVEDKDIAWSVGGKKYANTKGGTYYGICKNANSINIEMCVRNNGEKSAESKDWYFEDATVNATIELTKKLMKKYNIPIENIIRHYDVTGKTCPNPYVYNHTKHTWDDFKAKLADSSYSSASDDNLSTYPIKTGQKRLTVNVEGSLNVRDYPVTGNVVSVLKDGDIVTPSKKTRIDGKTWFYLSDRNGWCSADYLTGWIQEEYGEWWWLDKDYTWPRSCVREIDGAFYYFNGDGFLIRNNIIHASGNNTYFARSDGSLIINDWYRFAGNWYYCSESGAALKNCFMIDEDDNLYYFDGNGMMFQGEISLKTDGNGALQIGTKKQS